MGFCNSSVPGKGSDSVWFSTCFPALHQPGSTKGGGKQPVFWAGCPLPGELPASTELPRTPRCTGKGKAGRDVADSMVLPSRPIPSCRPVRQDTRSPGEQSSLRAITGFSKTFLPSLGLPENQARWSYTSMRESKLGPWLFSFIVSHWWCNMTNLLE